MRVLGGGQPKINGNIMEHNWGTLGCEQRFFPTCQVRVSRFQQRCNAFLLPSSSLLPSSLLVEWAPDTISPAPNTVECAWTRTPYRQLRMGLKQTCSALGVGLYYIFPRCIKKAKQEYMVVKPIGTLLLGLEMIECPNVCQKVCQIERQKECQNICQKVCPNRVPE